MNGVLINHFKTTRVVGCVDCASSSFTGLEIVAAANSRLVGSRECAAVDLKIAEKLGWMKALLCPLNR